MVRMNQCRDLFSIIFILALKPNMRPLGKHIPNSKQECFKRLNCFRQFRILGYCNCYERITLCVASEVECVWLWRGRCHSRSIVQIKFIASQILGLTWFCITPLIIPLPARKAQAKACFLRSAVRFNHPFKNFLLDGLLSTKSA